MFRIRLSLAFAALVALVCMQAAFVYWGANRVYNFTQHSRLASDILTELNELAANKQRLRVWASQRLMNVDASVEVRDGLLASMKKNAAQLRQLTERDTALWAEMAEEEGIATPPEVPELNAAARLFDTNIAAVQARLVLLQPLQPGAEFASVWHELNQVFDLADGRDLRELLGGAIERQRRAVPMARADTERGLRELRTQAVAMAILTLATAIVLAAHLTRRLQRPLDRLLAGTRALQAGALDHRVETGSRDEFDRVAEHFNAMAAELQEHRRMADAARRRLEDAVEARTAELRTAHEALQRSDERRRQLFADLSHELRTPATAIRGEAEIALRGGDRPPAEYRQTLVRIVGAVEQLTGVVEDLMLVARAEADQLVVRPARMCLGALLRDAAEQAEALGALHGVHVRLESALSPDGAAPTDDGLSEVPLLHADAERLRQALMIVLDNAVRYSHAGGTVRLGWQVAADGGIDIEVRDEGIGIDAEELPLVFQRFMRGSRARAHRADGTGIGLSIARSIVEAHQGNVAIESAQPGGTRVRLHLPPACVVPAGAQAPEGFQP
ncbi:sensor histidine kinase [Paracidovorax konjaci]|uniref:histidine kinase n=1 Tax=Paracidovorax konjaci TaxID=32040 RepID=A0A1I1TAC6_9BURK|nr:HAMP domain-containing sensor histidine kinase [Paracidovorax konjaci]SFD55549.1 His Kinase A (phospho-acceptor) domain-containing protein [Paracidovorax konjaci]